MNQSPTAAFGRRGFLLLLALTAILAPLSLLVLNAAAIDPERRTVVPLVFLVFAPAMMLLTLLSRDLRRLPSRWGRSSAASARGAVRSDLPDGVAPAVEGLDAERCRALVQHASELIALIDPDSTVRYVNASIQRTLGRVPAEMLGRPLRDLVHPDDWEKLHSLLAEAMRQPGATHALELRLKHWEGTWRYMEVVGNNLTDDPNVRSLTLTARDITERKARERRLAQLAFHDPLTRLANRDLFRDRVQHALTLARRSRQPVAVLYIDLDNFKPINDRLGHAAGDFVLMAIARRIRAQLRAADTAARLGGDEFAVLLSPVFEEADATRVASRLLTELSRPVTWRNQLLEVGASIGIAVGATSPEGGLTVDGLLDQADAAMYAAKRGGRGRCVMLRGAPAGSNEDSFRGPTPAASGRGETPSTRGSSPHSAPAPDPIEAQVDPGGWDDLRRPALIDDELPPDTKGGRAG